MYTSRPFIILGLLFYFSQALSQVQGLNYHIRYNQNTCLFDCCIIINSGTAITAIQRAQFSSQYSVVVPTGSNVFIAANHNPIQNNQTYNGSQPLVWSIGSFIANPQALTGSDIYSITPSLTPTSFYDNLYSGDTIVLFSLNISPVVQCGAGVRPFDNVFDPDSSAPGMGGGDFSNGFTLGSVDQKYEANSPSILPTSPKITQLETSCSAGLRIDLSSTVNSCQTPLSYFWQGPDGYSSTGQNINLSDANSFNNGMYLVTITDNYGCKDTSGIQAYAKPKAGPDQTLQCFSSGTATISGEGNGLWQLGQSSAGSALIDSPNNNITTVSGFSNPGVYYLIWSANGCSDTTLISTGINCSCNITNSLIIPIEHTFCSVSDPVQITGNVIPGIEGTYQWIYQNNDQNFVAAVGTNNNFNYQTEMLGIGSHKFRRVFMKTSEPTCADTSNLVEIIVLAMPNAGPDDTLLCFETDTIFLSSQTAGYWSIGQGSACTANFSSITHFNPYITGFSAPGEYFILRSNGICADTTILTVNEFCGCELAYGGEDKQSCAGATLHLTGNCNIGSWSALGSNPLGAILGATNGGVSTLQFSDLANGDFLFVYSVFDQFYDTIKISVHLRPVVSLGEDFGFCENAGPVILTASGANNYTWSTGQIANSIMVTPQMTTTYVVTGLDVNGCADTDTLIITFFEKPSGSIPDVAPVYEHDPLMLMAGQWDNAIAYQWTGPDNFISEEKDNMIASASMSNAGMYTLSVMSPDDCETIESVDVQVLERPLPLQLIHFDGFWNPKQKTNDLAWSTDFEINSDYFIINRSSGEDNFNEIARIKAGGNTSTISKYIWSDKNIVPGNKYTYNLMPVDFDGKKSKAGIVTVFSGRTENITSSIFPNPARETLNLLLNDQVDGVLQVEIYNSTGVRLLHLHLEGNMAKDRNILEGVSLDQFAGGVYHVKVTADSTEEYHKLVIIK